jgi:hypothetical protein
MTILDLELVKLDCSLIIFDRTLFLQNELFLIVEGLFGDSVACPRVTKAL